MSLVLAGPNLADWLQGWGTVAGSLFAALAVIAAVAVLRHDRATRRADEADAAAAYARAVMVLVDADWRAPQLSEVSFTVRNFGSNVILDVRFGFRHRDGQGRVQGGEFGTDYVAPGDTSGTHTVPLDVPVSGAWDQLPADMIPPDVFPTRVVFTDAAGRRWRRDGRAQPVRLGPDEDPDLSAWVRWE